jgi:membrane protease YdiL (CAAX protease family)
MLLALAAAFVFDDQCARRRLLPPGFAVPWRRALALALLTGILWLGVFAPLGMLGLDVERDVSGLTVPRLFLLHALLAATLLAWFLLGFLGTGRAGAAPDADPGTAAPPPPSLSRLFAAQFGFRAPRPAYELGLGLLLGVAAWAAVLGAMLVVGAVVYAVGGESALPKAPPALMPWIAALPVGVRVAVSVSAGVVEEAFFRGFLQPRAGILLSTLCFALAHASYAQPLMLVAVTLLSLVYASLVQWRQNVLVAVSAHALFDTVQLLVVIPAALELLGRQARPAAALLALG